MWGNREYVWFEAMPPNASPLTGIRLARRKLANQINEAADRFGLAVDPNALVRNLFSWLWSGRRGTRPW
jgi:hypothetical protein